MIKHIVLFRLTEAYNKESKNELASELASIFAPLATLPSVREFRTGVNFNETEGAWDFAIDSLFDSRAELEAYQVSEEHQQAIRKAAHIKKEKAVVDYTIQTI